MSHVPLAYHIIVFFCQEWQVPPWNLDTQKGDPRFKLERHILTILAMPIELGLRTITS